MQDRPSELQCVTKTPFDPEKEYEEHPDANPQSGLTLKSKIEFSSLVNSFITKFGKKILSGSFNVTTIIPSSIA